MGFPSPARDYTEAPINIVQELVTDPDATFFYRVETDALINAFVRPGSIAIVLRSAKPENGNIVLARIQGVDYLRILRKNPYKTKLCPANSKYPILTIEGATPVEILGVVTYFINPPIVWKDVCTG